MIVSSAARAAMAALLLAGCTQADGTTAVGMTGSPMWMATASQETKLAVYRGNCAGYGFAEGTPEMAQCVQQEAGTFSQRAQAQSAAVAQIGYQQQMLQQQRRPVYTSCNRMGVYTNCSTF